MSGVRAAGRFQRSAPAGGLPARGPARGLGEVGRLTTGQVAEMLGVQQAFLRSLDAAGVVSPDRSGGGHRRYSRRQLDMVVRLREQLDQGHTLAAAARIVGLQDELAAAHDEITVLRHQVRAADEP